MKNRRYKQQISLEFTSPAAVIHQLEALNNLLPDSDLQRVVFFNRAYLVVTKAIQAATFAHPETVSQLEMAFVKRYFAALNHYAKHGTLPGPWRKLTARRPAIISLLLGASAHINYDLLPALHETVTRPNDFAADYAKVGQLLLDSSKQIAATYHQSANRPNILQKLFRRPIMQLILHWRTRVWRQLLHG